MIRNAPLKNYYDEVLRLVPDGSASGQIATIDDGAKDCPLKSLVVDIEPIQSGSGNPSPSNVRAISARSEVAVTRTGKNLFNKDDSTLYRNLYLNSSTGVVGSISGERTAVLPCKPSTTYTISALITTTLRFASFTAFPSVGRNPTAVISPSGQTPATTGRTITTGANDKYLAIQLVANADIESGTTVADVANVLMLEVGSTATAYEPYTAQTITISLGQSIYGGTLDVKNGILEITHELLTVDGTADWNEYGGTGFRLYSVLPTVCTFAHGVCNEFKVLSSFGDETGIVLGNNNRHLYVSSVVGSVSGVSDLATWKTFLNSSPMVFTAPTASPTTVSLSPIEIRTLYGINNLWSDSGETAVTYKANATLLYEKIRNAIIAQGGQI